MTDPLTARAAVAVAVAAEQAFPDSEGVTRALTLTFREVFTRGWDAALLVQGVAPPPTEPESQSFGNAHQPPTEPTDAETLRDFMEDWYDCWVGPGEDWTFRDLAESIVESFSVAPSAVRREATDGNGGEA